jgi:hypothetical protein
MLNPTCLRDERTVAYVGSLRSKLKVLHTKLNSPILMVPGRPATAAKSNNIKIHAIAVTRSLLTKFRSPKTEWNQVWYSCVWYLTLLWGHQLPSCALKGHKNWWNAGFGNRLQRTFTTHSVSHDCRLMPSPQGHSKQQEHQVIYKIRSSGFWLVREARRR